MTGEARFTDAVLRDDDPFADLVGTDGVEQLFESGFTTAEEGTGLGPDTVRAIAEAHDWTVTVTGSARGRSLRVHRLRVCEVRHRLAVGVQ